MTTGTLRSIRNQLGKSIRDTWNMLDRTIFTGERYEKSMRGMRIVSLVIIVIGTVMSALNIVQRYYNTLIVSLCIVAGGCLMYYFVVAAKKREAASLTALIFAIAVFTYVTATGTMDGFAILWTTLIPLIVCYFFNVKYGILLFLYFEALFCLLFYTPLRRFMEMHYTGTMMNRYPILYLSLSVITSYFMIRYHKSVLDQMDYEEQLRKSKQEADRSNAAKSDFLASMSHEIRTPINAVLGMNEMILRESLRARDTLPEKREKIMEMFADISVCAGNIESAGNGLLSIINDILDFSKIEAGKLEIMESDYQLSSILNDMSNMIAYRARDKGLEFRIEVDQSLPDGLHGDEVRVRQVVTNVLNNAVKYTREGSVTLSVSKTEENTASEGDTVRLVFTVSDTGIGIRKEDIERLFMKFERVDLAQNSTVEGTGLGLAITRSLLDLMNGSIQVESEYGRGSVFVITLPQKVVATDPVGDFHERFVKSIQEMHGYEETFHAPEAHILIVDDTRMNLMVAAGLLKNTEIRIDTAGCGAEAIECAGRTHYDLILMDQRMPEMDGTEALHHIRDQQNGPNQQTPVICLTADAVIGAKEKYLADGFTDYLSKPIDSTALEKILIRYLPDEKVIRTTRATQPETADRPPASEDDFAPLRAAGIQPETGLKYCQEDGAFYRSLLLEYAQSAEQKMPEMERDYQKRNWKSYGILVHALKSSSRMIGAESLAKKAAEMEAAAGRGQEDIIRNGHERMMCEYNAVVKAIREISDGKDAPADSGEEILEFLPEEEL